MAGRSAAASALSSPWRTLLQRALDANAHLRHSTYFQLATVGAGGRPANRTVVFRGFQEHCDKIQINTDARSNKIGEIKSCPFGEICWYFTDSWEQFRISGSIDVIDASSSDPAKLQKTKNKVGDTLSKIKSTEETLETLYSRKGSLEKEIDTIKGQCKKVVIFSAV